MRGSRPPREWGLAHPHPPAPPHTRHATALLTRQTEQKVRPLALAAADRIAILPLPPPPNYHFSAVIRRRRSSTPTATGGLPPPPVPPPELAGSARARTPGRSRPAAGDPGRRDKRSPGRGRAERRQRAAGAGAAAVWGGGGLTGAGVGRRTTLGTWDGRGCRARSDRAAAAGGREEGESTAATTARALSASLKKIKTCDFSLKSQEV
jgi:hypothetical protein